MIKTNNKEAFTLVLIFLFALFLRICYWIFTKDNYLFYEHPGADVVYYNIWSREIAYKNILGTKTFYGLPLYPYFLAILQRLSFGKIEIIRLFHMILGSINCILIFKVADKIFSKKVAFLSSILCASNFMLIYYDWLMMPITLITSLSILLVGLFVKKHKKDTLSLKESLTLGLLTGIIILGSGKILIFIAMVLIYMLVRLIMLYKKDAPALFIKNFTPLLIGIMIILSLTGLRNKIVGGSWVWIGAQSGLSMFIGNNASATGTYTTLPYLRPTHSGEDADQKIYAETSLKRKLSDAEVSQFWRNKALKYVKTHPIDYIKLLSKKTILFFSENERSFDLDLIFQREYRKMLDINPFYIIFPLACIGIFLSRKNKKGAEYAKFIILSQLFFTLIFFLNNRHRATVLPFFIMFESYTILWIIEQIKEKKFKLLIYPVIFFAAYSVLLKPSYLKASRIDYLNSARLGPVYDKRKEYKKAEKSYLKALSIKPKDTNSMYNLANSYFYAGKYKLSEKYYLKTLKLNPLEVDAIYNLGYLKLVSNKYEEASKLFEKLIKLQPKDPYSHSQLARSYDKQGLCSKAIAEYKVAISLNPDISEHLIKILPKCTNQIAK